ncbi:UDP-glucose 4-epimerase [compost metagenome]
MRQVVETVRSVSGVDFRADEGPRRAGDPASITATGEKVRKLLGWVPQHDDLQEIVESAYWWERHLMTRNR